MVRTSDAGALLSYVSSVPKVFSAYMWKNVAMTLWFGPATLESCASLERSGSEQAAEHPEGLSLINIMVPGVNALPDAEARAELMRILRQFSQNASAVAVLIPGTGFWASAQRGMVVALSMFRPREMQLQIFGSAQPLVEWLVPIHAERTGVPLEAAELLAVFEEAERHAAAIRAAA